MRIRLKYLQWLVFWLMVCVPFSLMAATSEDKVTVPARADFAFAEPYFETLGEGKLPAPAITALLQDAQGWLWIGINNGLVRYDGYRMRKFAHDPANPTSLAGAPVTALWQAPDGRLWVGTSNDGVSIFDPKTEQFTHLRHDTARGASLVGSRVWALTGDGKGGVWIGTDKGLYYVSGGVPSSGAAALRYYGHEPGNPSSLLHNRILSLLLDKQGTLWVGSAKGLQRYQAAGLGKAAGFVSVAANPTNPTSLAGKPIRTLFQARDGKLWIGMTDHGAVWLNPAEPDPTPHWLPIDPKRADHLFDGTVKTIIEPQDGQIWLGTAAGGIHIVAAKDGTVLQRLQHDPANPSSPAHDNIRTMVQDKSGTLWIGTLGGGLQRHHPAQQAFKVLRHRPAVAGSSRTGSGPSVSLSHPEVRSALELTDGRILVGTGGNNIDILDRKQGVVGNYMPDLPNNMSDGTILALAQTPDGTLWAGSRKAGVLRLVPGSMQWQDSTEGLALPQVRKFLVDHNGALWAATGGGIARWQAGSQRFVPQQQLDGSPLKVNVVALAQDRQGQLWAASSQGLWLKTPQANGWQAIAHQPGKPGSLPSNQVEGLLVDASDRLWVSTTKGLARLQSWNGHTAVFESISAKMGKQGQNLGANLWQDQAGRIWLCKDSLLLLDLQSLRLVHNAQPDLGWACRDTYPATRDGLLVYGGSQGLAIFDPAKFTPWTFQPPVRLTELKINGQETPPGRLSSGLRLTPDQRNFSVEFAALDFSQADLTKTRYRYRLQGYDKAWINTDSEHRVASYGNLWPGRYTLKVQSSNREGGWSVHELSIPIRVLPAWWQTWWFALVFLLLISSLLAALVQMRTRYLRQRQRVLEQVVADRTRELRQKQAELVDSNHELSASNNALNESNVALNEAILALNESNAELNESNDALNEANADLALSVETLRQLGDIGREITSNLDADIVFQSLYLYVGGLLNAPTMTIYRMNAAATALDAVFGRDDDQVMPMRSIMLNSPTSNVARTVRERQELLMHYDTQIDSTHIPGTRRMRTALFAPLIVDDRVLGVMSVQSDLENAYGERECLIFRTLSAYGAIALANAAAIAGLRQAQCQLVQQEKMASLGGLVAGIAHEINTPLGTTLVAISGVEGAWQKLRNAITNGRLSKSVLESSTMAGMEYTALALKTASRAAELIALFKTISVSADSDRTMEIDLAVYLEEVATLVHTQLVHSGCKLEVTAPTDLSIQVVVDALTEALSRILVNTLDHGFNQGRTGTLRIGAKISETADGDEVVITVNDDGHGIAPENLPKVFDPFFTTKSGAHGHVGLGLHVAYNHVTERLKGKIQITSTLGEGTCVTIRLKQS
jgi:ligand-binding sensor domain-containing protein/C4-dicarboxylate-specific signal transduction histidine kinase